LRFLIATIALVLGTCAAALAMTALVGAGMIRNGPVWLVAIAAVSLVLLPARALASSGRGERTIVATGSGLLVWSLAMLVAFSLYFPGERKSALKLGLSSIEPFAQGHVDSAWADTIDDWLPEIGGTRSPPPEAAKSTRPKPPPVVKAPAMAAPKPPPAETTATDEVVLPTEGRRGSLRIPVTVEGERRGAEVTMIFDTGATLTTLDRATLRKIGIRIPSDAPKMKVHTAAGPRETQVVLVPKLWVGGFEVEGVSVSVCDACVSDDAVGLLGLNVSERFLVTVDGAREEIVLSPRKEATNRGSDVGPWVDLDAEATRWPDGRTLVLLEAENKSKRWIERLTVAIQCDKTRYADIRDIGPAQIGQVEVSIAAGTSCESFQVSIDSAVW
jgi:clan AA aspartic protease (TIGR02281 family)